MFSAEESVWSRLSAWVTGSRLWSSLASTERVRCWRVFNDPFRSDPGKDAAPSGALHQGAARLAMGDEVHAQ